MSGCLLHVFCELRLFLTLKKSAEQYSNGSSLTITELLFSVVYSGVAKTKPELS